MIKMRIAEYAGDIAAMFKNPKVTILVRAPDLEDGDVVVSDDDLGQAALALEHLRNTGIPR